MRAHCRFVFPLLTAVFALLAGCGNAGNDGAGDPGPGWAGETIRLGSVFSTSGPGVAFGPQQMRGARLALERINSGGGINGAELALEQIDDRSEPDRARGAARRLIEREGVLAVLGPTFSNSAAEAHPLADRLGTPMLAVSNTGPGIVGDCPYPCENVFRASLAEEAAIPANVSQFASQGATDEAVVVHPPDDPFGESTAKIAAEALRANGIEAEAPVEVEVGDPSTLRDELAAALPNDTGPVFIATSSGEAAAAVIEALRRVSAPRPVLGGNAFNSALALREAGADGTEARSGAAWFAGSESAENEEFKAAYRERWDEEPDQFAAQAYTGVLVLAEAARAAELGFDDPARDREALAEALEEVRLPTPLGEFAFTDQHDVSQPIWVVAMQDGREYRLLAELPPE